MSITMIVFQGPSASGKSTLQSQLGFPRVITWTSRQPRTGEIHGREYHFTTKEQLEQMLNNGDMLEMTEYRGNYYGTSLHSIREAMHAGNFMSTVMDAEGAGKLKELFPEQVLLIGVSVGKEECRERLSARNSDEAEVVHRLDSFEQEIQKLSQCDLIIHNGDHNLNKASAIIQLIRQGLLSRELL